MSQVSWSKSDDKPGRVEDQPEAPAGQVTDDSYVTGKERDAGPVPVIGDDDPVEAPVQPTKSDSDEALGGMRLSKAELVNLFIGELRCSQQSVSWVKCLQDMTSADMLF
ncbi:hypothetical protein IWW34DRAFT_638377 [Fusarium oxysporum f. sp. albedinis]|uniref:Uncharacterized protein n=1 Tax=Fusarium oxysporum (strain Fo5176) TaxID=660025 RepID=F9FHW7_FUSOF|nr:hypothetical protein FOXB_05996 [Fusarium oxysporum f. sp. conglutinans Fo5176]KAI3571892.1 hypothetical protein IWW34DRAFT_638377 [Fusarium oxysporum f. sp. albedinis]